MNPTVLNRMTARMARPLLKMTLLIYAAAVLFCTMRVVGNADGDWLVILTILTLPWSLIAIFFVWSLIHGASLWFFWIVYLAGGAANAFLFHQYVPRLCARLSRKVA